jgi:hypothetical protein
MRSTSSHRHGDDNDETEDGGSVIEAGSTV